MYPDLKNPDFKITHKSITMEKDKTVKDYKISINNNVV